MGGKSSRFPHTRHSAIIALQSEQGDRRAAAYERIVAAYWKPAYKHVRLKWNASNEDAKDLTQEFFARALEKEFFARYDSGRGSFRNYLRTCLDRFVANQRKSGQRLKRGGDTTAVQLDFEVAEAELRERRPIPADEPVEDDFQREWVRSVLGVAVEALEQQCAAKGWPLHFRLFQRYDLFEADDKPSYRELADEFGLELTDVTNYLAAVRREFRTIVLLKIRELTATEQEFRSEVRAVLGQ
jgi:DNA-directed RNA polymerase specialized sigma24 family protein